MTNRAQALQTQIKRDCLYINSLTENPRFTDPKAHDDFLYQLRYYCMNLTESLQTNNAFNNRYAGLE